MRPVSTLTACAAIVLTACSGMTPAAKPFEQRSLPAAVQVPAGNRIGMDTVGVDHVSNLICPQIGSVAA